jgi:hypothetical protein
MQRHLPPKQLGNAMWILIAKQEVAMEKCAFPNRFQKLVQFASTNQNMPAISKLAADAMQINANGNAQPHLIYAWIPQGRQVQQLIRAMMGLHLCHNLFFYLIFNQG